MMARSTTRCGSKFILHFANEHIDFKLQEITSIASILGLDFKIDESVAKYDQKNPFLVMSMASATDAKKLMERTILTRTLFELWGHGRSWTELFDDLKNYPAALSAPYLKEGSTFRINVEAFNKKIGLKEKVSIIESIPPEAIKFNGRVNLKNAEHVFSVMEYYGPEGTPPTDKPLLVYFGRWIANGQRERINEYHLQNRHFIGNTSMDACLSLIMANMGKVKENSFVMDPFVGTGSLLVSSAHFGGYVMGTDLDYLLLHAKGKPSRHNQTKRADDESIRANLRQYGFERAYIDVIVADASRHEVWRHLEMFDAIITDPPYGIREPAKKIAIVNVEISEQDKTNHIPMRVQYQLSDIFKDLLNFSAKFLRLNGRLVFWFPVIRPEYSDSNIPRHPCFKLIANSEQPLNTRIGRRLITMEKIKSYQEMEMNAGASYEVDHFGESSFRDRYFKTPGSRTNSQRSSPLTTDTCGRVSSNDGGGDIVYEQQEKTGEIVYVREETTDESGELVCVHQEISGS